PSNFFISEIPMYLPAGQRFGHHYPENHDRRFYKIIFTEAQFYADTLPIGRDIVVQALNKVSVVEVWVDLEQETVEQVFLPPEKAMYKGIPVPVY
ncbi:MAG: hypothetical protein AAF512_19310, partial [Pseudomonadota bacterium]